MYFDFGYVNDQDQPILLNEEYGEQEMISEQSIEEFPDYESDIMDDENSVPELQMELGSMKEVLETQSRNMNEFHGMLEDLNIHLNRLQHSKEDGCQKYEEVIQLCQKIQKIQCGISEMMDKAVAVYETNIVYDQMLLSNVKEHCDGQSSIELERKAIYNADIEEIKKIGETTIETLKTGLLEKQNFLKIVSEAGAVLKTQMGKKDELDIEFLNELILKQQEHKLTIQKNLLMVQEECKNIQKVNYKTNIEGTNEVAYISSQLEEIHSLLNNEKVFIDSQNENINHFKNKVQELTIYSNELKEKIQTEEVSIEMMNKETEDKKNQYCNLEVEISNIKDSVSNLREHVIRLNDLKHTIEKNESILNAYKNDLEIKIRDKSMFKSKVDTIDSEIKVIDSSLKSQHNHNYILQQNINLLSSKMTHIDSLIQEERILSTQKNEYSRELEDMKKKNIECKIRMEDLNDQNRTVCQNSEAIMKEKFAVLEKLNLENAKVKESECLLKQREWEYYMESMNIDTRYEHMLTDLETKSSELKVIVDLLGKIAFHQNEMEQLQVKLNDEKNALNETNSTKLEEKILEVRNLKKSTENDLRKINDELSQVKDDYQNLSCEIQTLEDLNVNTEKCLEKFECEQFLLETHIDWLKSLTEEGIKMKQGMLLKNDLEFDNVDDIFISSDAEEDEFKTQLTPDSDSTLSVIKNNEFRNAAATIPLQIQRKKPTQIIEISDN